MTARVLAALVLSIVAPASAASAQPGDDPQVIAEARRLFEEGLAALEEGRFAEAADTLMRSLELRESAPARYNRALALRGAGRYRDAIAETERYIALATGPRHQAGRVQAEELLTELRGSLGRARIVVVGGAERIEVDGELVGSADGTFELEHDPGLLRLLVSRAGHRPLEVELAVPPGGIVEHRADASAAPLPSVLSVEVEPVSGSIRVDGELLGLGRARIETAPGPHQVELAAAGHIGETRDVELPPGDSFRLSVSLRPEPTVPLASRWWFWTLIGTGAVALGTAITVAAVRANDVAPIETGTLGFAQEVLRSR